MRRNRSAGNRTLRRISYTAGIKASQEFRNPNFSQSVYEAGEWAAIDGYGRKGKGSSGSARRGNAADSFSIGQERGKSYRQPCTVKSLDFEIVMA